MTAQIDALRRRVRRILTKAAREFDAKRDAGICVWPECQAPALRDRSTLFFGGDHCEPHARRAEVEALADEQADELP